MRLVLLCVGLALASPAISATQGENPLQKVLADSGARPSALFPAYWIRNPETPRPDGKTAADRKVEALELAGLRLGDPRDKVEALLKSQYPSFTLIDWGRRIGNASPDLGLVTYKPSASLVVATQSDEYLRVMFYNNKAWYIEHSRVVQYGETAKLKDDWVKTYGAPSWVWPESSQVQGVRPSAAFSYKWLYDGKLHQYLSDNGTYSGCEDHTILEGYTPKLNKKCGAVLVTEVRTENKKLRYVAKLFDNKVQMLRQSQSPTK